MTAEYGSDGKRISKRKPRERSIKKEYIPENPRGKLTDDQVRSIRLMHSVNKLSMSEIGTQVGVSVTCVYNIVHRIHRRDVPDEV